MLRERLYRFFGCRDPEAVATYLVTLGCVVASFVPPGAFPGDPPGQPAPLPEPEEGRTRPRRRRRSRGRRRAGS